MKIIVLVKMVPDSEARISIEREGLKIEEKYELNYFDELAVEEAIRIKEARGDCSVLALTYGPRWALESLRKAVSMGADEAVYIESEDDGLQDGLLVAGILSSFLKGEPFDLILCGRKATDDEMAQVGPMVAGLLGIPHVSAAVALKVAQDARSVEVVRDCDGGKETIRMPLPALVTAQKGLNEPRVPSIQGVMKGMKLAPRVLSAKELQSLDSSYWRVVSFREPPKRPPVKIIEGDDPASKARELLRVLRGELGIVA